LVQQQESGLEYKAWVTEAIASRIAEMAGYDLDDLRKQAIKPDFKPVSLGISVSCKISAKIDKAAGVNILGVLPGSDPELSKQAVLITAHHDHLGIGKVINGDSIYNGAIDNEESGLIGSEYYVQHPTFAPENIAADVNIDFVNIWGKTRDVVVVGYGKSTIDDIVRVYAEKQGRVVVPDQTPELGMFYRSDQYSFAKIGIPGLYLDTGKDFVGRPAGWGKEIKNDWIKTHYHQPSDEYNPDWDLSGHLEDMNLLFHVILELANQDKMPEWVPGDEFEKVRRNNTH
jgi:Zn-dependent M28 family amino/carboxypeptidase